MPFSSDKFLALSAVAPTADVLLAFPLHVRGQVVLGTFGTAFQLVADGGAILLLQVVLEALLTGEESQALLAVSPGFEWTQSELPAASAALLALVSVSVGVANVAGLAVVGLVHET